MKWITALAMLIVGSELLPAQLAKIRVAETVGLRRFGYPVRAQIVSPLLPETLTLSADGKPVAGQFTRINRTAVAVDFAVDLAPWEQRTFLVEQGSPPPVATPMSIEQTADSWIVHYPGDLAFRIPKNLAGLLSSVGTTDIQYLSPGSRGLTLNLRDNTQHPLGAAPSSIVKAGPLACGLRFESTERIRGDQTVRSVIEMEFPRSKSWTEVRWTVDDPNGLVSGLMAEVSLFVDRPPVILDFGAGSMIYAALRSGQSATMRANASSWSIDVNGARHASGHERAEGWAHIMDPQRATAVAVADFGNPEGSIEVRPDGRLSIRRDRLLQPRKSLNFWLHFVPMPVQIGAATSPQSMMRPPKVTVSPDKNSRLR